MPIPSDYPFEPAADTMKQAIDSEIGIYHYGFLRHREEFFLKAKEVQRIWVNSYDPRLQQAESFEGNWMTMPGVTGWEHALTDFTGTHPQVIRLWLAQHGYQ
jgi:hypothetical protein